MLLSKFQEPQSCWANYVPNRSFLTKCLVLLSIQMLFGAWSFASQAVPATDLFIFSSTTWVFELDPGAGSDGYLELSYLTGQQSEFSEGSVSADLAQDGESVTIHVQGWADLPTDFSGKLAMIEVFGGTSTQALHRFSVQADGGEVIVVLMDD